MATIAPYVATSTVGGQKVEVKAKTTIIWLTVGRGAIVSYSPFEVAVAGKIKILGYEGDLKIHLQLTDKDEAITSGPCSLRLNQYTDSQATYTANGKALTVAAVLGGVSQNISIMQANDGAQTECKLFGKVNQTVHLAPLR
jgi:hypothetical protein